jgi:hypothetical protein
MKRKLFFLIVLMTIASIFADAQSRGITRGAEAGELYMARYWYGIYNPDWGPPVFDTLLKAIYHITDYGKKAEIAYAADVFIYDEEYPYYDTTVTIPGLIIADATSGVLYNQISRYSSNLSTWIRSFWASFDYGKTWTFKEEDPYQKYYYAGSFEGMIYKILLDNEGRFFRSFDYGLNYEELPMPISLGEQGLDTCEFWSSTGIYPWDAFITHTMDCGQIYDYMPIDSQYFFSGIGYGIASDVYRGTLSGEVYVSSWFPDWTYKISFSADTGRTFRIVYHSDSLYFWGEDDKSLNFMSDREAGVFYIVYGELVEVDEPWGYYRRLCFSHYRDYGETLVGTYCHDFKINYPESCAGVMDMEAEVVDNNNVALRWGIPETEHPPTAYRLYRNNSLLTELPQTAYFDESLPNGSYTYSVRAVYYAADTCESLSYNIVKVTIEGTGIEQLKMDNGQLKIFPNPTGGELRVESGEWRVENVEIFDLMGRRMPIGQSKIGQSKIVLNGSHLPAGMYFIRIQTENSVVTRKIVKQ